MQYDCPKQTKNYEIYIHSITTPESVSNETIVVKEFLAARQYVCHKSGIVFNLSSTIILVKFRIAAPLSMMLAYLIMSAILEMVCTD